ncbi:MAG: polysaccharide biosynthesis protein [Flavobacteriales bacterium]|nr:polysaccharide biosynthesis protein [Flavobacteriales bacterium]|tara:strand:- start:11714 stop:13207 length:1494 start_codon:yes stop_codon:yes gene_type:complete
MFELKQLFHQTIIYGFSSVIARVLNFFLVPLYTILFMPSEYAIIAEMYAYAGLFMVIGSFGMETTFFRFVKNEAIKSSSTENTRKVFSTAFTFLIFNTLILLFLGFLFLEDISFIIEHENHPEYIALFIIIVSLDLLSVIPFSILREQNRAVTFAVIKTINICINIFFNLFFLLLCPYLLNTIGTGQVLNIFYNPDVSVVYVFISNLIASTITLIILTPIVFKNYSQPDYPLFKKMIKYAWPIFIAGLAFILNETADKILIKYLLPTGIAMRELGIYSACYKLTIFMTLFVQAYRFAAEPFFFHQLKSPNPQKTYSLMMNSYVLFSLLIFLFVVLFLDTIKLIIPNQLFHEGVVIVPIVLLANLFLGIYYNLSVWYKVINQTHFAAIISTMGAIITLILNIILIPTYGYIGAAWTTLICYFSMCLLSVFFSRKRYHINYDFKSIIIHFCFALFLYALSNVINNPLYINIQIDNAIIFFIYIIFIFTQMKKLITPQKN